MEYIQKIVPIDSSMLQVPLGYDVISYRIEHIRTANNPPPFGEFEKDCLYDVPEKYLNKYNDGAKIAPFIRIYRTIAPYSEVKKFSQKRTNMSLLFKDPQQIKGAKDEICYASFSNTWTSFFSRSINLLPFFLEATSDLTKRSEQFKDEKREYRKVMAPKLKHGSNKFMRKCLAVDDFFDDAMKYLNDPSDFYRDEILKRAVSLDYIFEECKTLNTKLPEGFANETSGLTKLRIADILNAIEILKWQIGINKTINDGIFNKLFRTEDVLWKSNEKSPIFYEIEESYISKNIARNYIDSDEIKKDSLGRTYVSLSTLLKINPHKTPWNSSLECFDDTEASDKAMELSGRDRKKTYWTKEKMETRNFTKKMLDNIDIVKFDPDKENDIDILKKKIAVFNDEFINGFLNKNIDKYPAFISERLKDVDEYPGIILYMFDEKRRKHRPSEVPRDPLSYEFDICGKYCIFNHFSEDSLDLFGEVSYPVHFFFDFAYLMDYSDTLVTAGEAERKGLTVYEALQKMQAIDPKDNIASRFLAELVSEKINRNVLLNKWDELSGHKTFKDTEEKNDPAEAKAIAAFKLYRKTMEELTNTISSVSSLQSIVEFDKDPYKLPSFYDEVEIYLLNRIWGYSRISLNREFNRESIQQELPILDYIKNQNKEARITRNRFAHGINISESEFIQFMGFCNKIRRVAEDIIITVKKEIQESIKQ